MATVLDRVHRLLALAESPNENEARNAAVLAVRLIREHRIVLVVPTPVPERRDSPRKVPVQRRTPGSKPNRKVADVPTPIQSPLGGECVECGGRYRSGSQIYWLSSGGGLHPKCVESWTKRSYGTSR